MQINSNCTVYLKTIAASIVFKPYGKFVIFGIRNQSGG